VRLADSPREPLPVRAAPACDSADVHVQLAKLPVGHRERYISHQGKPKLIIARQYT
jgi:hypothetical protein